MSDEDFRQVDVTPSSAPVKRAVEQWGADKGIYPHVRQVPGGTYPVNRTDESGAAIVALAQLPAPTMNADYWKFAGAKAFFKWPEGAELTEAEFDSAIDHIATGIVCR